MRSIRLLIILFVSSIFLAACSTAPTEPVEKPTPKPKPVSKIPELEELVGTYSLFSGSENNIRIVLNGKKLSATNIMGSSVLQQIDANTFRVEGGRSLRFEPTEDPRYYLFKTTFDGREEVYTNDEMLTLDRASVRQQKIYTWQMLNTLKPGGYTFSRFLSPSRGLVDYSVYLPPNWKRFAQKTYPLVLFLHGQTGWERSFPDGVPAKQLNEWISSDLLPPMVIVSLRAGRLKGKAEEQWSSERNETLLTSQHPQELRAFIKRHLRAGLTPDKTAIHGHSRGARGALHYSLKFPQHFSSAVANAFVSDYALPELDEILQANGSLLQSSSIPLRMSIGDRDEFELGMGRKGTAVMHNKLTQLGIQHEYQVFPGIDHGFVNLWNVKRADGKLNGLAELLFHVSAWIQKGFK